MTNCQCCAKQAVIDRLEAENDNLREERDKLIRWFKEHSEHFELSYAQGVQLDQMDREYLEGHDLPPAG